MPLSPKVTICIPTDKALGRYLLAAINSVITQSVNYWELIIIDGGREMNVNLKKQLAQINHPGIRYVKNNSDTSMAGNWNYAFKVAETDLVTLLHDDDMLEPTYIERVLLAAEKFPDTVAFYTDAILINEINQPMKTVADSVKNFTKPSFSNSITHLVGDKGLSALLKGCFIFCPTLCYRKSKLPEKPFNDRWKMVTDFQFYFDTLHRGGGITGINEKLYKYRRHSQNQTMKLTEDLSRFQEEVDFYNSVAIATKAKWSLSYRAAKQKRIIKLHIMYLTVKSLLTAKIDYAWRLIKFYFYAL